LCGKRVVEHWEKLIKRLFLLVILELTGELRSLFWRGGLCKPGNNNGGKEDRKKRPADAGLYTYS
jgi:hypothetical protein